METIESAIGTGRTIAAVTSAKSRAPSRHDQPPTRMENSGG